MRTVLCGLLLLTAWSVCQIQAAPPEKVVKTKDIRIRDPFIYADANSRTYYLYAQAANRADSGFTGVEVYCSRDLVNWQPPTPVLTLPDDAGVKFVWAPEVHEYNGRFYLFVTLTYERLLPEKPPVESGGWPAMHVRGTHVFQADSPGGPFQALQDGSHTPESWMALDGTLFVDQGKPYMVFCHEWVQVIDGSMDYVPLKANLSGTVGSPARMFRASIAPGAKTSPASGKVTDGCFLYRSEKSGRLFMLWSTFVPGKGYCVVLADSESGRIGGPWTRHRLLYTRDGGHAMLFRAFDGRLLMALHQPNRGGMERLHLFTVDDRGDTLAVTKEVDLK